MARCGHLDADGKQCKRNAVATRALHLDGEIFGDIHDPDMPASDVRTLAYWVVVPLCKPHADAFEGSEVKNGKLVDD